MSDAPKEEGSGKKKGGKLPIIAALVLMLGGGGFFMTKKNGHKEKPKIALAKEEIMLEDEYIVNMADGRTYIRAKIGLRGKEGFKAEEVTSHNAEVSDAIITILKTTKPSEINKEEDVRKLKIRIAAALNKIFEEPEKEKDKDKEEESDSEEKDSKKKKKKGDHESEEDSEESSKESSKDELPSPDELKEGWDSKKGPILKVFFKALATQ